MLFQLHRIRHLSTDCVSAVWVSFPEEPETSEALYRGGVLHLLRMVFGGDTVFDFSGRVDFTSDYNNFADPHHFGSRIGWQMIEEIYNPDKNKLLN